MATMEDIQDIVLYSCSRLHTSVSTAVTYRPVKLRYPQQPRLGLQRRLGSAVKLSVLLMLVFGCFQS